MASPRRRCRPLWLLDAAGKELVLLETVGAGQSEVEVIGIADTVLLVLMPGSGDSVQALKGGDHGDPGCDRDQQDGSPGRQDDAERGALDPCARPRPRMASSDRLDGGCQQDQRSSSDAESGRFWSVTFSERFKVRCVTRAGQLVREGRIGQVVQTLGLGPHREGDRAHLAGGEGRPGWFYDPERTGGILTDIASHQIDQFLWFTGADTAEVVSSTVANYAHPEVPRMQDFGEAVLRTDNAHAYIRVDWYTPQGLSSWGDGRLIILGTDGYMELRKYVDIAGRPGGDHLIVVDSSGTEYIDCSDVPLTYYPQLVSDVINRTETACPQQHTYEVMRLAILAQQRASMSGFAR